MTQFVIWKNALCAHDKVLLDNLVMNILTIHCNIEDTNNIVNYKHVVIL